MTLLYNKNIISVLSACEGCGKGVLNMNGFICKKCIITSCHRCGKDTKIKIHTCVPSKWFISEIPQKTIIYNGLNLKIAFTVLASACRASNINMYCAEIILSYYSHPMSYKNILLILKRFLFLKKNFYIF